MVWFFELVESLVYFFEDITERSVTVNGKRYKYTVEHFLWPQLEEIYTDYCYFLQNITKL